MSVIIRKDEEELINKNPPIVFPYTLDVFQKNAINAIESGEDVLVTAHTSAGKSTVAEYAIALAMSRGQKVVYTSPIKTLSNQKFHDFEKRYESVGILTGDIKKNPEADCIVMTTEILRNMISRGNELIDELAFVIFDEVHYFNDEDRGYVWEESITMLPPKIGMVMLSATISNAYEFADWIAKNKKKNVSLVGTNYRPVPLNHYIFYDDEIHPIMDNSSNIDKNRYSQVLSLHQTDVKKSKGRFNYLLRMQNLIEYLKKKNLFPALMFSFSRAKCEKYATSLNNGLLNHEEISESKKIFNKYLNSQKFKEHKDKDQTALILKLLEKGIGFHHSGLVSFLKEIQEILFNKGYIKILFCTETFSVGVSMPTRTVIFSELEKHDGKSRRLLNSSEYTQMAGRSGRRGLDTFGTVIYFLTKPPIDLVSIVNVFTGKSTQIKSKLKLNTLFLLKIIKVDNFSVEKFIESSLLGLEDKKQKDNISVDYQTQLKMTNDLKKSIEEFKNENTIDQTIVDEYFSLKSRLQYSKANQAKKINKKMRTLIQDDIYKKFISDSEELIIMEDTLEKIRYTLSQNDLYLKLELVRKFLQDLGFLTNQSKNILELDRSHLTRKGLIGSDINECNEILLTEVLVTDILNSFTPQEICGLLAIFVRDNKTENQIRVKDLTVPENMKDALYDILDIDQDIYELCLDVNKEDRNFILEYDANVSLDFVEAAYMWALGHDIKYIYQKLNLTVYEGNFVKNIIKIINIANEIVKICEVIGKSELVERLGNMESLLLRDIVSLESIYV